MPSDIKIVAIVPARGGSKGIHKKNLALLNGKPLIAYAIEAGRACAEIDRVIVSTDDEEIAVAARQYGAEVPFMRPEELARDDIPDRPVFLHLIKWLQENEKYSFDYLINLRCTTPLKRPEYVSQAVRLIEETGCDSVRTADRIQGKHHPYWMYKINDEGYAEPFIEGLDIMKYHQRQLLPPAFAINAVVDIMKVETIVAQENPYGTKMLLVETDPWLSIDIDSEEDLIMCETRLRSVND